MPFPSSPTNGQTYVLNNTSYTYNSALGTWTATQAGVATPITIAANTAATSTGTGALQVIGGIGVQGNIYAVGMGFNDGTIFSSAQSLGSRNRLINGDFRVDQRSSYANVIVDTTTAKYYIDRWSWNTSGTNTASKGYTGFNQGTVTSPTGFYSYYGWTTTSVPSTLNVGDYIFLSQKIEGINTRDLGWGQPWARNAVLSFWTRSNSPGVYTGFIRNNPNFNSGLAFNYNIPTGNTWTYVSIPVTAPTSGTWNTDVTCGIELGFAIWNGNTFATTNSNTWTSTNITGSNSRALSGNVLNTVGGNIQWTGVQFEAGTYATPYEFRHATAEIALCQRYYYTSNTNVSGTSREWVWITYTSNGDTRGRVNHPIQMRVPPSMSFNTTSWNMVGVGTSTTTPYAPVNVQMTSVTATAISIDAWSIVTAAIASQGTNLVWGSNQGINVYADAEI